jgi:DNA repair protein RecO (recombination protein O)
VAEYQRTEGVCLRRLDFSNSSQVATFLTPDQGKLSFLAKGKLRAPKAGLSCGFELLGRYELIFTRRRAATLHNLAQSSLIETFQGVRRAIERALCAYYAAEIVSEFTTENERCPALYGLLLDSLRKFDRGESLGLSVLTLEVGVLKEQGLCPTFNACAECSRSLPSKGRLLFSPEHGGALCPVCARLLPPSLRSRGVPTHVGRLRLLAEVCAGSRSPGHVPLLKPAEVVAASRLLRFHIRHILRKELKMWKYLQDRHLTRTLNKFRRRAKIA